MDHKEVFKELAKCKIKGMMFHSDMADYYAFLQCCTFKKLHDERFIEESEELREIKDYYITNYNRTLFTDDEHLAIDNITPKNWDEYGMTEHERLSYIKHGIEVYEAQETKVKEKMHKLADELYMMGCYDDYKMVRGIIDDVVLEIHHIRDLQTYLEQTGFNMADEGLIHRI